MGNPSVVPESTLERRFLLSVEYTTALAVFVGVLWGGFWLVFGPDGPTRERMAALVRLMSEEWKAFLVVLVPLYYRSVRVFMGRVIRVGPVEAPPLVQPLQVENPTLPPPTR